MCKDIAHFALYAECMLHVACCTVCCTVRGACCTCMALAHCIGSASAQDARAKIEQERLEIETGLLLIQRKEQDNAMQVRTPGIAHL